MATWLYKLSSTWDLLKEALPARELRLLEQHSTARHTHARLGVKTNSVRAADNRQCGSGLPQRSAPRGQDMWTRVTVRHSAAHQTPQHA